MMKKIDNPVNSILDLDKARDTSLLGHDLKHTDLPEEEADINKFLGLFAVNRRLSMQLPEEVKNKIEESMRAAAACYDTTGTAIDPDKATKICEEFCEYLKNYSPDNISK